MTTETIETITSFGKWVRRRRKALDLTQAALAQHVGCAKVTIKKIEYDERRPSRQLAELLADHLLIPAAERETFICMARGKLLSAEMAPPTAIEPGRFKYNLPTQPTPFVGREKELADITRRLQDPACRLLTLIGPGGVGKTRLAIQAAQSLVETPSMEAVYPHGLIFVPLTPVSSLGGLVAAMAEAANFTFYSDVSPRRQLLDYLREKRMLLLLDNFEQLLSPPQLEINEPTASVGPDSAEKFVAEILRVAPGVKIVLTSRVALNLYEAWFHPVDSMSFPQAGVAAHQALEDYDAVRLFVQSARRARVGFSLTSEGQSVVRICRLVEGMPLAIELAAIWLKILPCEQIAGEIERNLDFLAAQHEDVPPRHRSMQAVFEQSWQLLAQEERTVLKRLSVFRGGFRREAGEQVAGASLLILRTLVEKSLLRASDTGRYQIHELLRQFAAEKLGTDPAEETATRQGHSRYYLALLQRRLPFLKDGRQQMALAEIGEEIENVRAGWRWAVAQGQAEAIDRALESLYDFYQTQSRYQEGEETFGQAATSLPSAAGQVDIPQFKTTQARLLARWGAFCGFLGQTELARKHLQTALTMARALDQQLEIAFCLNILGQIAGWQGNYAQAWPLLTESLAISRAIGDREGLANTLHILAEMAQFRGENGTAKELALESLAISRALGRRDRIAYALDQLGFNTYGLGEYSESEKYYQEGLAIFEEIGDKHGMSLSLGGLGLIAVELGSTRHEEAKALGAKALALAREGGHRFHIATRLGILGYILNGVGEPEAAHPFLQEGVSMARVDDLTVPIVFCLGSLGDVYRQCADLQASRKCLLEALKTGLEARVVPYTSIALVSYAALQADESDILTEGDPIKQQMQIQALELIAPVCHHPACRQEIKNRAARLRMKLEGELPSEIVADAWARGKRRALEDTVRGILADNGLNVAL